MKVAVYTTPEGHLSIAESIKTHVSKKHDVVFYYDRDPIFNIYKPIYQFFPVAHKVPFTLSKFEFTKKTLIEVLKDRNESKLTEFYTEHHPDVCISTNFMYNPMLERFQDVGRSPLINIITDPWTIHPLLVSTKAAANCVFDEKGLATCQDIAPDGNHVNTGWFVRPEFTPPESITAVRRKLGLDESLFTILITAGSEGTMMIVKLIPALLRMSKPTQIVVVAGNNQQLYKSMTALQSMLNRFSENSKLIPLGYVENMHEYMQASDFVVGKAGPNTLFESVATHTPFMAVTHIPGQEDGNLDIIREYQLGYVEENPLKAIWKFKDIIETPHQLNRFKSPIKKLAKHNAQAGDRLLKILEKASNK